MPRPQLHFFCELDAEPLVALAARTDLVPQLRALDAGVTLGLRDLSVERAAVLRDWHQAGVPVGAWLLLPRQQGYFATPDNVPQVEARVDAFLRWREAHHVPVASLGLDFEPALDELDALLAQPVATVAGWVRRARDEGRFVRARAHYTALVARLRGEGLRVEAYQPPMVLDDRRLGGTALSRITGAMAVSVDREVVMLYSSLYGVAGPGLVALAARECSAIGLGSTGGGVDPLPKLSWAQLERDLLVAAAVCRDLSLFSLEGCVAQGFLPRLVDFDWSRPAPGLLPQRLVASAFRAALRLGPWWVGKGESRGAP